MRLVTVATRGPPVINENNEVSGLKAAEMNEIEPLQLIPWLSRLLATSPLRARQGAGAPSVPARGIECRSARTALQAAERVGVALLVVHALSDRAKQSYLACWFRQLPLDPMTLMTRVKDLGDALK